jgi:hypothetical protein
MTDEEELKHLNELNKKLKTIVGSLLAEKTGFPFICGMGEVDPKTGLPNMVMICPAYGSDIVAIYKLEKSGNAEW